LDNDDKRKEVLTAIASLLYTGLRISESKNITWNDIDFNKKLIKVTEKTNFTAKTSNSYRNVPLNKLYEYLVNENKNRKSSIYIFTSPLGKQLRERRLLEKCKEIGKKANIDGRVTLHKFRHTFASHLVMNKIGLERVQKLLGHSSIHETLIYAHLTPNSMHEDLNVLNNLG